MQTQIDQAVIQQLVVHRVGNANRQESLFLSQQALSPQAEWSPLLLQGYLKGLVSEKKRYQFVHPESLVQNTVYRDCKSYFANELDFLSLSHKLARHLFAQMQHPNIPAGDMLVIEFSGLSDGERLFRAIGVFKVDTQDDILSIVENGDLLGLVHAKGINPKLIDKGALILEYGPEGYALDRQGQETRFWLEDFLGVIRVPDLSSQIQMASKTVQNLSAQLSTPLAQAQFEADIRHCCDQHEEITPALIQQTAEQYLSRPDVEHTLQKTAEQYGFGLANTATLPAANLSKKLQKQVAKYAIGYGISALIPADLLLEGIDKQAPEGSNTLTITLTLQKRDVE